MKPCHELLRGMREDRDLKQSQIADMISTTQQQYSKYETGESELPLRALVILAQFYGVSADYLVGIKEWSLGVPGLDKRVTKEKTAGDVMSEILSLEPAGRDAVVEYIALQKMKECCAKKKEKDGK